MENIFDIKSLTPEQKAEIMKEKQREWSRQAMRKKYYENHDQELEKAKEKRIKAKQAAGKPIYETVGRPRKETSTLINISFRKKRNPSPSDE